MLRIKKEATKQRKQYSKSSKPSQGQLNKEIAKKFLNAAEEEYKKRIAQLDTDAFLFKVKTDLDKFVFDIPASSANKTLAELKKEATSIPPETLSFKTTIDSTSVSKNSSLFRSRAYAPTRNIRRSKSQVTITKAKTIRKSQSLSRAKVQHAIKINSIPYGLITPKVQQNTPSIVLRRPKHGEMAISMQGSPLMVSSIINERVANVNIPLEDGRIISIQPNRGLQVSECPALNEETREQIKTLRDNLNRMCNL